MADASRNVVLVVSNSSDFTSNYLCEAFLSQGIEHVRLNTESFPTSIGLDVELSDSPFEARITVGDRVLDLRSVRSIWWRRPAPPVLSDRVPAGARHFLENEAAAGLGGVLRMLNVLWVNHPEANERASYKLAQLVAASRAGWNVPRTLVTSDPAEAVRFARSLPQLPVIKPIDSGLVGTETGRVIGVYSRQIAAAELDEPEDVRVCPVLLQERVEKRRELRLTVMGEDVIATEIAATDGPRAEIDWREIPEAEIRYKPASVPGCVGELCVRLLRDLGLSFGAFDVIETPTGSYVFLEVNPNGQWAWLEMQTEQPIRASMIRLLTEGAAA